MKKYYDPELEVISFDVEDRTNFGDNDQPIDEFSEPNSKGFINW